LKEKNKSSEKTMKKIIIKKIMTLSALGALLGIAQPSLAVNYGEALQKSIYFYEAQQAGPLPAWNRVPWRADSTPTDGADVGVDLRGGWFDAGDHVKFGFPMASSTSLLAWGVVDYRDAYAQSGQLTHMLNNLRFVNDYFIKAHPSANVLYGQVGVGAQDHTFWGPAEVMHLKIPASRVSMKIDSTCPGVDLAAETAAAMASSSMAFKPTDAAYASTLLTHATQLFNFAEATKGTNGKENSYTNCIKDSSAFYNSNYGVYWDELAWAAVWLWRATGDATYLTKAKAYYDKMGVENQTTTPIYTWGTSWNDKAYGVYALMAGLVGDARYHTDIQRHLDFWSIGGGKRTPGGIIVVDGAGWGVNRYAANTALLALYYADKLGATNPLYARYHNFGKKQIDYILGDNPANRSFMVGFGVNPPKNVHHRGSHGSWTDSLETPAEQRHILYGAVAGGPSADVDYADKRSDYIKNEVATDYNSGFTGAAAILYKYYGGNAIPDAFFPPAESVKNDEYLVGAKVNSAGTRHVEIKAVLQNRTTTPAKGRSDLYIRYFYNLSEVFAAGYSVSDLTVSSGFSQASTISALKLWAGTIYYVEITFGKDTVFPGGQSEHRREVQFRVALPTNSNAPEWDNTNDPSYDPAFVTTTEPYGLTTNKIAIYGPEGLLQGVEPPKTGASSSAASTAPSSIAASSIAPSSVPKSSIAASSATPSSSPRSSVAPSSTPASSIAASSRPRSSTPASSSAASSSAPTVSSCSYIINNEWNTGFVSTIRITNNTSAVISGWQVSWSFPAGVARSNGWNATVTGTNPYTATPLSWNTNIQPGGFVEFGMQGTKPDGQKAPVPVVTGAVCQ
jgi:endoglucanase